MKTKTIFKTLALAMLMPAMLLTTACSNDDDVVNNAVNTENTINKGYALPVTVNVTRGDGATRASYNESTRKLEFSTGDKLFVYGSTTAAGSFAGALDYVSEGTFSGTIYTEKEWTGTADALFTAASAGENLTATLLPNGYDEGSNSFLSINNNSTTDIAYDDRLTVAYSKAFVASETAKATGVEQLSLERTSTYSSGFALAPLNAILNFTITGLEAGAKDVSLQLSVFDNTVTGSVTPNASGVATFAIGVSGGSKIKEGSNNLTVGTHNFTLPSSTTFAAGKIYNITRGPGKFTINSSGDQVYFSQGNLQATTTDGGTNWTWAFAEHQWDYVGNATATANTSINGNGTVSANGTVEFFCWSTASTYYGIHNSQNGNTYSGDFKDWGTLSISNGGGYTWRTLTSAEWKHIFNDRTSGATVNGKTDARYAHATINTDGTAVNGIILFPDGCNINSSSATWGTINGNSAWGTKCTKAQWSHLESLGCVFLPAAGSRHGSEVGYVGTLGCYWSATPTSGTYAYLVEFGSDYLNSTLDYWRDHGRSVRLVRDVAAPAPANKLLSAATAEDIGKVVCAAGHLHPAKTAVPSGCTAVGILGKVTATGQGLILALADAPSQSWNTINGWTSVDTYAGTTLKQLPAGALGSLTSYTKLGSVDVSNWCVAQKSDYEAIFINLGSAKHDSDGYTYDANVNAYITTGVGGTAISDTDVYWSTTEKDGSYIWAFSSGFWNLSGKSYNRKLWPVLGF